MKDIRNLRISWEIVYTAANGVKQTIEVADLEQAKMLGRNLALASGHRTILTRKYWDPLCA